MPDDMSYKDYAKLVSHYIAVGQTSIYLYGDHEKPWEHAISCEGGSMHRLDIATDVNFKARYGGLEFRWSFDIEPLAGFRSRRCDRSHCRLRMAR